MRKGRFRRINGLLLVAIYTVITLSPIAPVFLHSKTIAHAITGECVGDCNICGCLLEARESNTCCCAKKQQLSQNSPASGTKSHCPLQTAPIKPPQTAAGKRSHCADEMSAASMNKQESPEQKTGQNQVTVFKCGSPCSKGKLFTLNSFRSNEHIPICSNKRPELPHFETRYKDLTHRLISRHCEPPDPPPKLAFFS